ncbi:MAG: hypothetical protein RR022_06785 [Angelakisella sp.]
MSIKRRWHSGNDSSWAIVCIAFGLGIFLALFCSLRLVVILAAAFLVVLGFLSAGRC